MGGDCILLWIVRETEISQQYLVVYEEKFVQEEEKQKFLKDFERQTIQFKPEDKTKLYSTTTTTTTTKKRTYRIENFDVPADCDTS